MILRFFPALLYRAEASLEIIFRRLYFAFVISGVWHVYFGTVSVRLGTNAPGHEETSRIRSVRAGERCARLSGNYHKSGNPGVLPRVSLAVGEPAVQKLLL